MIELDLQDFLATELGQLFSGMLLKNPKNDSMVPLNIYAQDLPATVQDASGNNLSPFPYIIVRLNDGEGKDDDTGDTCKVMFIVGVFDDDESSQGHRDVMNILEKIRQHLFRKRLFQGKFACEYPYKWTLNEEDVYPYFFGGLETNWTLAKMIPDNEEELI